MPRPSTQLQTRLAIARVNQRFSGVISQSANTSRGSRSEVNLTAEPSGKMASKEAPWVCAGRDGCATRLVGFVLGERSPDPTVIRLRRIGPKIDRKFRLDAENVAPFHGPVIGEFIPIQESVNQQAAFVRVRIADKIFSLACGWERANDIQI